MTLFITLFATSFMVALSGAIMPGPLLTVTISESSRRGLMTGPLLIAGHALLELALVVALLMGLAPLLTLEPVFIFIALAGSAVLLWMGVGMLKSLPAMTLVTDGSGLGGRSLILSGILMSLVNPYWSIWWATIGLGYILHSMKAGTMGVVAFFTGHILGDLFWYAAVSTAIWKGRRLLSDRGYRILIGTCAIFLIVFSCLFAWSGMQKLFV
ncbi:lysine transporter LysE [Desulfosarcina alkanivorans]|jgi:threonine/homoserine/homoserine lactone efflux protein|uniref:Lysine transporter LysE n=1 Tax=Desulfosarcina alkanivorans TaxID=571177 RepID=A0A5K7YU11_9BACT|nr:LysE family transporter [Desulfosarcina alkanivorans]BBO70541.1 lysine transporter LysE [Desulfosarcina alkanivorans]